MNTKELERLADYLQSVRDVLDDEIGKVTDVLGKVPFLERLSRRVKLQLVVVDNIVKGIRQEHEQEMSAARVKVADAIRSLAEGSPLR